MKSYESISINRASDEPIYLQLYAGIRNLIDNNVLKANERLPAIRNIASEYGVNNVTIIKAYKFLEKKGYVYSKIGSGTFVREISSNDGTDFQATERDTALQGYIKMNSNEINFSTATPNPKLFPINEFKEVLNQVLDRDGGYAFGYQESQGFYPLRESIKYYLGDNGIKVEANDIHVISGAQQGIDVVSKALIGFNDTIIVESPTYTGAIAAFKSRGAKIIEIEMMNDGIDIDELEEVLRIERPKLIYVMTNFQNPTGISYSHQKKLRLLTLAEQYGFYILEDDYLSELRFYGEKNIPIKTLDIKNKVIYLKSFSKIFMPGIRLGFLITPRIISQKILSAKHITDISTAGLMQRALDLYLRNSMWKSHLEMMWDIYKIRYDHLIELLKLETPFIKFIEPFGGLHIWAETDIDASMFCNLAKQSGVAMATGSVFYLDGRKSNFFRISFAGADNDEITRGIEIIRDTYNKIKNMYNENIFPFV
jgi:DNA-binding transcriptional MocR family regulator